MLSSLLLLCFMMIVGMLHTFWGIEGFYNL